MHVRRITAIFTLALLAPGLGAEGAFSRRKPITIDFNQVSGAGNLTSFPVLISLVDSDLELAPSGDVTSPLGHDIVFRAEDDTTCGGVGTAPCLLDHEIESFDAGSGTLVAFVRVPVLQGSANTTLYMYYGDASITSPQENPAGVWDPDFREVYHLAETGDYTDSTANGFTAVPKGTVTQSVAGRVGAGARFNGPTESRVIASDGELAVNQSLTFEAWVYFTSLQTGDFTGLVTKGRDGADWFGLFKDGANRIVVGSPTIGGPGYPGNLDGPVASAGTWYHLAATYDMGTTDRHLYINGTSVVNDSTSTRLAVPEYLRIGDDGNTFYHDGLIDEVRISNVARSPEWIQTTHNNQFAPLTFYTPGPEDSSPPSVSGTSPALEAPCQGLGTGTCNFRSIGTRPDYGTSAPEGGGTTLSATASSRVVTGAATAWLSANRGRGDRITIEGVDYTILSVDSETRITLSAGYAGTTGAGKSYNITRKFSTLAAWESCVDGGAAPACEGAPTFDLVADNRAEIGIVYDDGAPYTYAAVSQPILNINGAATDATHTITLTVDPGNRHDGTAGSGVVLDNDLNDIWAVAIQDDHATVEWLEITGGATTVAAGFNIVADTSQNHIVVRNNLVHDVAGRGVRVNSADARVDVLNNIIYETASQPLRINQPLAAGSRVRVMNNTFYNPTGQGLSSIESVNPHLVLRNNLIFDSSAGFNVGWINVGSSHNLSDDPAPPAFPGTPFAPDIGHSPRGSGVYGASVASVGFNDTTPTAEDLHIQSGSSAEDVGADLSGVFTIDIDGLAREAPWDIGADELTANHHYRSIGTRPNYGTAEPEGGGTTVTATNGSPVVTGSGTSWYTSNRGRGDRITIDLTPYTILSVDSDTQLTLTEVFSGASGAGKAYAIARKFATLAAWEDCIDGPGGAGCEGVSSASLVGDNRSETGIVYDDSTQAGGLVIDGSVTDATHTITLTADPNNRHLGIEGGGALIDNGASTSSAVSIQDDYVTLEWLEVANGGAGSDGVEVSGLSLANSIVLRTLLVHDTNGSALQLDEPDLVARIYNNFIYSSSTRGIRVNVSPTVNASIEIYNNTLYANAFNGIQAASAGANVVLLRNNVAVNNTPNNYTVVPLSPASSHNLTSSGSTHSPAGGGVTAALASLNFVSTSVTYIDLHIQNGSAAEGVGVDLSAFLTNDIDDDARDATWDMGADAVGPAAVQYRSIGTLANYVTGTVTAATGSTLVTGSGTTWLSSNRGRGDRIVINGVPYTVLRVDSETQLQLTGPFEQASASGLSYSIERKFATLADWEMCVDGSSPCPGVMSSSLVSDRRREVGIAYADTAFGASVAIEGATTDATHNITLTADGINRHYGIAGAGVEVVGTEILVETDFTVVEWLEVRNTVGAGFRVRDASNVVLQYLISRANSNGVQMAGVGGNSFTLRNSIIYGNSNDGIAGDEATDLVTVENCTVYGNADQGLEDNNSPFVVRNTISMGNTASDYSLTSVTGSNNISSDGTAPGTSSLTGRTATDNPSPLAGNWVMFQSLALGGENLHLIAHVENDAIDTGLNLSTSFTTDIDDGNRTLPWDVGADDVVATTEVELVSFEALARDGAVELLWETGSELDNLGFNLYRSLSSDGPYERVNARLVPGLGSSPAGARYSYRDSGLENGRTYFYRLEDVDTSGRVTQHGPVSVTPSADGGSENDENGDGDDPQARVRYGDPEATSIEILHVDPLEVVLELRTEGFYATPLDDGTVRIEVPGFEREKGLPVKLAWVEAVAGRDVALRSAREDQIEAFSSLTPADESHEAVTEESGTVRIARRRHGRRAVAVRRLESAELRTVAFQGEEKKALVALSPLRWDGKELLLAKRLRVHLSMRRPVRGESVSNGNRGRRRLARPGPDPGAIVRFATGSEGLHAVRYEDIARSLGRQRVVTDRLFLQLGGEPVPYRLEPPNRRFGPGSTLFFVSAPPSASSYSNELVYELHLDEEGERMQESSAAPSGSGPTVYTDRIVREENRLYQPSLLDELAPWLWELVIAPETKDYTFRLEGLAGDSEASDPTVSVRLRGTSDMEASPDHHVRFFLNGNYVGETSFEGKNAIEVDYVVPPGVLVEGENVLSVENVGDTEAAYSIFSLDRFRIEYPRRALAPNAHVIDVTDERNPLWLAGIVPGADGARFDAAAGRRYLVVPVGQVRAPEVRVPRSTELRERDGADYIAIGPRALLDGARPLLDYRKSEGLRVRMATIEDVYEEFGAGAETPEAIRAFIEHAYHEWESPSPRYVLLVGDATYDFKNVLGTGVTNQVPPYSIRTSYLWTASDLAYVAVNGDDFLPDLAIGRLPASTPEEARTMALKVLDFETRRYRFGDAPVVLVTDNPDSGGDFDANASELARGVLLPLEPEHLSLSALGRDRLREAIFARFDAGASLVSYIGHGGIHLWANEAILELDDVGLLATQPRQPLVLTMNCLNGYFHFPYTDALAEALVAAENRGAIAAFAPTGLSLDGPAHTFHGLLLGALANEENVRLGDAVLDAQASYVDSGAFPELLRIYHLLGDPALRLR